MAYNAIIFKIPTGKDKHVLVIPYHDGLVLPRGSVKQIVRNMEQEHAANYKAPDDFRKAVALNWLLTQPAVVSIGDNIENLVEQGILTLPYEVIHVAIGGDLKFRAVPCNGPNAQSFYDKGKKPSLLSETVGSDVAQLIGKAKHGRAKPRRTTKGARSPR